MRDRIRGCASIDTKTEGTLLIQWVTCRESGPAPQGDPRNITTTKLLFAITGIDASPAVLQICPSVRNCRLYWDVAKPRWHAAAIRQGRSDDQPVCNTAAAERQWAIRVSGARSSGVTRAHVTANRLSRGAGPPVASACSSFDFHVGRGQAALRLAPICTDAARCMAVLAKTVGSSR